MYFVLLKYLIEILDLMEMPILFNTAVHMCDLVDRYKFRDFNK